MTFSRPLLAAASAALVLFSWAACAGESAASRTVPSKAGPDPVGRELRAGLAPVDTTALPPSRDSDPWSLVEAFLSGGKTRRQEEAEIEETTATCMRAAGWRYEPTATLFTGDLATIGDLRSYRAQSGYGMAPTKLTLSAERDTNGDYLASLPPERRKAYLVSLHGSSTPGDESGALVLPREDAKGCRHRAERHVRLGMPRYDERLQQFRRAARLPHHPALRNALTAWSSCMRGRGFAYSMPQEIVRELSRLWTQGGADVDEQTRRALLQRELEVARADVDCYVTAVHPVQRVLEQALLNRIAAAFPQYAPVLTAK